MQSGNHDGAYAAHQRKILSLTIKRNFLAFLHLFICHSHKVHKVMCFSRHGVSYRLFGLTSPMSELPPLRWERTLKTEYCCTLQNNRSVKPNSKYAKMRLLYLGRKANFSMSCGAAYMLLRMGLGILWR